MSHSVNWDSEFGGSLLRLLPNADATVTRQYLDDNGTYFEAYDAWFIEGWEEYVQDPDIVKDVIALGPMIVPSLGGLTQEQLEEVVEIGFLGHSQPEKSLSWLEKKGQVIQ